MIKKLFLIIRTNKFAFISFCFLLFFFILTIGAPFIAPYSFAHINPLFLKLPPSWMDIGNSSFILGTDDLGRDLLSRLIYGIRISMSAALMVVIISVCIGTMIGLLAAYYGGYIDKIVMATVDIMMSFPSILLAIIVVAILGPGLLNTVIAVNIMSWPAVIRIVRGETLKEKNKEYIIALHSMGAGFFRKIFNILPNISGPLIVQSILSFSDGILNIAALGFLGLGAQPPLPELGTMISDGRDLMMSSWWLVVFPGICILFMVLCFNILGGVLRDTLDSKV